MRAEGTEAHPWRAQTTDPYIALWLADLGAELAGSCFELNSSGFSGAQATD